MLNQLVQALGSGALSGVAGSILNRVLGHAPVAGSVPTITPAQASQLSPDAYLKDVLERLPTQPASRIADLLPHRWTPLTTAH
jgi:hypothetical protein